MSATIYAPKRRPGSILNTTAATANQVAVVIPTDDDVVYTVEAKIWAVSTDNFDEGQFYWIVGLFKNDGGTLSQIGSTQSVITALESVAGRDVDFNVSNENIQVRVSPADTTPLTWMVDVDIVRVTDYNAKSGWIH